MNAPFIFCFLRAFNTINFFLYFLEAFRYWSKRVATVCVSYRMMNAPFIFCFLGAFNTINFFLYFLEAFRYWSKRVAMVYVSYRK